MKVFTQKFNDLSIKRIEEEEDDQKILELAWGTSKIKVEKNWARFTLPFISKRTNRYVRQNLFNDGKNGYSNFCKVFLPSFPKLSRFKLTQNPKNISYSLKFPFQWAYLFNQLITKNLTRLTFLSQFFTHLYPMLKKLLIQISDSLEYLSIGFYHQINPPDFFQVFTVKKFQRLKTLKIGELDSRFNFKNMIKINGPNNDKKDSSATLIDSSCFSETPIRIEILNENIRDENEYHFVNQENVVLGYDEFFNYLKAIPNLKTLKLLRRTVRNPICIQLDEFKRSLQKFLNCHPSLTSFELQCSPINDDKDGILKTLATNPLLERITVWSPSIDANTKFSPRLNRLELARNSMVNDILFNNLDTSNITHLILNKLEIEHIESVSMYLFKTRVLRKFTLSGNDKFILKESNYFSESDLNLYAKYDGYRFRSLFPSISLNKSIDYLYLKGSTFKSLSILIKSLLELNNTTIDTIKISIPPTEDQALPQFIFSKNICAMSKKLSSSKTQSALSKKRKDDNINENNSTLKQEHKSKSNDNNNVKNENEHTSKKLKTTPSSSSTTPIKNTSTTNNLIETSIITPIQWDGSTPIEQCTIGDLLASLSGRQHNLRIEVAEYINKSPKLYGFPEKSQYLLNWTLENLAKSFDTWKLPEKSSINIKSKDSLNCKSMETTTPTTTTVATTSSKKKSIPPYEITSSPAPSLKFLERSKNIAISMVTIYVDSHEECVNKMAQFLENSVPLFLNSIRSITRENNSNSSSLSVEEYKIIDQYLELYNFLYKCLLNQTTLKNNSKNLFSIILNQLLPSILVLQYSLELLANNKTTTAALPLNTTNSINTILDTISSLLQNSLYHPESAWDTYNHFLFEDWLKRKIKSDDKDKQQSSNNDNINNNSQNDKPKNKKLDPKQQQQQKEESNFQSVQLLNKLSQLIHLDSSSSTTTNLDHLIAIDGEKLNFVTIKSLKKFLEYFIKQFNRFGKKKFSFNHNLWDAGISTGSSGSGNTTLDLKFVEFGYFRKLFNIIDPQLLERDPRFYIGQQQLLTFVSENNIYHLSNQHQQKFFNELVKVYIQHTSNSSNGTTLSGISICIASIIRINQLLVEDNLVGILIKMWSSPLIQECDELMISLLETYQSIRQIDSILKLFFKALISTKITVFNQSFLQQTVISKLGTVFNQLPFGQVPIIWEIIFDEWNGYYITQLNEPETDRPPAFVERLTRFSLIMSTYLEKIEISSFVSTKLQQLIPSNYNSIVDPILNYISITKRQQKSQPPTTTKKKSATKSSSNISSDLILPLLQIYSSFLQIHSFIHRKKIIEEGQGQNNYGYHPQQFYYYQLCEEELEMSKISEFLYSSYKINTIDTLNRPLLYTTCRFYIQRIQQLNSILQSVSIVSYNKENDEMDTSTDNDDIRVSNLLDCSPENIDNELHDVVKSLLNHLLSYLKQNIETINVKVDEPKLVPLSADLSLDQIYYSLWNLTLENIFNWSNYASTQHIKETLKLITSPQSTEQRCIQNLFTIQLGNSSFYELKPFQKLVPQVLCSHLNSSILECLNTSKKNPAFEKEITSIFNSVQEIMPTNDTKSIQKVITKIFNGKRLDEFKSISVKDFQLEDWSKLIWYLALIPSFHPLYLPNEFTASLLLLPIVVDKILNQVQTPNDEQQLSALYKSCLAARKFILFCLEKEGIKFNELIPSDIWIHQIFINSHKYSKIDDRYPILHTSFEILDLYIGQILKNNPSDLEHLIKSIKSENNDQLTMFMMSGIFKSVSQHNGIVNNKNFYQEIKPFEVKIKKHLMELIHSKSSIESLLNHQVEFSCVVYHLRLIVLDSNYPTTNKDETYQLISNLVGSLGPLIASVSKSNINQLSHSLQSSITSILDLYSRIYSRAMTTSANEELNESIVDDSHGPLKSLHLLSLLAHLYSVYPENSIMGHQLSNSILQFIQNSNQLRFLLVSISGLLNSQQESIQKMAINLLNILVNGIVGTRRISSLLKNCTKLISSIVTLLTGTNSQEIFIMGMKLLSKLVSIKTIDIKNECVSIILYSVTNLSGPFIYSIPRLKLDYQQPEDLPMELSLSSETSKLGINSDIFDSLYTLLYNLQQFRLDELSKYLPTYITCLRYLLYSVAIQSNQLLDKHIKKVSRLLEYLSNNNNAVSYFQFIIVDYIQIVKYSTTSQQISITETKTTNSSKSKLKSPSTLKTNNLGGPQYGMTTDMRSLLLPGIFSLIDKYDSNLNRELFNSLDNTGKGIFQNLIDEYQSSFKYTGK
eukprot:gene690-851_t